VNVARSYDENKKKVYKRVYKEKCKRRLSQKNLKKFRKNSQKIILKKFSKISQKYFFCQFLDLQIWEATCYLCQFLDLQIWEATCYLCQFLHLQIWGNRHTHGLKLVGPQPTSVGINSFLFPTPVGWGPHTFICVSVCLSGTQ